MKEGLTEVVFILDRSGSMSGLEADTIGGFNSMLNKQKLEDGEVIISTVLFDDQCEVLYDRVLVNQVEPMNEKQYYVRGCTALLDAIGGAVHHISKIHKSLKESEVPEKTLFIITTDGMENSSRKYNYDKVKKMVEKHQKKHNWEFMFLGANIDAISVAGKFGIGANRSFNYHCDGAGTSFVFQAANDTINAVRRCSSKAQLDEAMMECCAPLMAHYNENHK